MMKLIKWSLGVLGLGFLLLYVSLRAAHHVEDRPHALLRLFLLQKMPGVLDSAVRDTVSARHFPLEFFIGACRNRVAIGEGRHKRFVELAQD